MKVDELRVRFHAEDLSASATEGLLDLADALVRALLELEWCGRDMIHGCDICGRYRPGDEDNDRPEWEGHAADCALDAALTAAGLPDQASRDAACAELAKVPR